MTEELIKKFKDIRIGVIGDAILDTFLYGDVRRISPEAPVPVVAIQREEHVPGGAANVAANIVALGGRADLISMIGSDARGRVLAKAVRRCGISSSGVMMHPKRTTIQKTRIVGGGQHIVRMDHEATHPIDTVSENHLLRLIERGMRTWDIVVVSDYAKGLITPRLAKQIILGARRKRKKAVVDTKPTNSRYFKGAFLFTPNGQEAVAMANTPDIRKAGSMLRQHLQANILITQGIGGMTLFWNRRPVHIPADSHTVFDVVGAGDTVVAVCALALGAGADLEQAARLANHAAGLVVEKPGTATISFNELLTSF